MAVKIKRLRRVFRFGGTELPDPSRSATPEKCLELLSVSYPALTNAITEPPSIEGDKEIHVVKVSAGTKG